MSTLQQHPTLPTTGVPDWVVGPAPRPAGPPLSASGPTPGGSGGSGNDGNGRGDGRRPRRRPGWLAMSAVAVVAAAVASGTTAALVANEPAPSAVGTTVTRVVQGNTANPDWTATAAAAGPSVVSIDVRSAQGEAEGSGVILDAAGHVVTNHHVVAGGGQLTVTLSDRRVYRARVIATDPGTDLAVIQLIDPPANLAPIAFGDVSGLRVGQPVMALGNPLGLSETVTTGIISALDRPVVTTQDSAPGSRGLQAGGAQVVTNAIQTNAAINPGNSGGALVNANGELIGITSSIATLGSGQGQSGNLGIGFAIPADQVKAVTDELIATGQANHAYLGVSTTDTGATVNGADYVGAGIREVAAGTPAASAGLRVGDVIIGIDNEPVTGSEGLIAQVRDRRPGREVTLKVARDGKEVSAPVVLTSAPN